MFTDTDLLSTNSSFGGVYCGEDWNFALQMKGKAGAKRQSTALTIQLEEEEKASAHSPNFSLRNLDLQWNFSKLDIIWRNLRWPLFEEKFKYLEVFGLMG